MDILFKLADFVLHVDVHLENIINHYGMWTLALLFLIIFMETGFVVTPFLPGDSLLFAAAALAARPQSTLDPCLLFFLLAIAAVLGDTANYWIGRRIGTKAYSGEVRWIKKEYMERTHVFFEKHGGKTIFLARFVPIIRTFAPFVAGVSRMPYGFFIRWNVIGGVTWVAVFTLLGWFFGSRPFVQKHFELVIVIIIAISVVPVLIEAAKARREFRKPQAGKGD